MSTVTKKMMFPSKNHLPEDTRKKLVDMLNQHLASVTDLYLQTKHAHWNVRGSDFYQVHELFDDLAGEIFPYIDTLAERATALGGSAMGTLRLAAQNSTVAEYPADLVKGHQHIEALSERYASYSGLVRSSVDSADELNDQATVDLFNDITRTVEKALWFLEAHIHEKARGAA